MPFPHELMPFAALRRRPWMILPPAFLALILLWWPGLRLPVLSDTTVYALLGESLWRHGTYVFDGAPYAKHLPLHAFVSYPFISMTTAVAGMKISSLLAGWGVLLATYLLIKRAFSPMVAVLTVVLVLFHHGFVLIAQLGSADLLFTALFLGSLAVFTASDEDPRRYLLAGLLLGLASLTRYNAVLLFLFYPAFVAWKRPRHFRSRWFWSGLLLALVLFGLWFLRNYITFGDPFFTAYSTEYHAEAPFLPVLLLRNTLYYLGPFKNVLPFLFVLGLLGLWRFGRSRPLLLIGMVSILAVALLWWVRALRFAFPAYPIFLAFAAAELLHLWGRYRRARLLLVLLIVASVFLHVLSLCLYSYGSCNAWFDRTVGRIPADLHLSPEGLYGISVARDYIDTHAATGAFVLVREPNYFVWNRGVFRPDLRVISDLSGGCPAYEIEQRATGIPPVFVTPSVPRTMVLLHDCPR